MKRYAAVKVPPEGKPPPGSRMLRTGGARAGALFGFGPFQGLALSFFSPGREPHGLDRSGTFRVSLERR